MEIKIKKCIDRNSTILQYLVDGKSTHIGREITGHTGGDGLELLQMNDEIYLDYGMYHGCFDVEPFYCDDTPYKRLKKLIDRIQIVRSWIRDCQNKMDMSLSEAIVDILDIDNINQVLIIQK
jgi:hypothetical protein